ncbi:MAG: tetratricopeptide repeat protein, partial [Blastocatellia bacterium]
MLNIKLCYKLVFCIIIVLLIDVKLFAQNNKLTLDNIVKSGLAGKQKELYDINVETNQSIYIIVQQQGIDVVVTIYDPEGKKISEIDSPNGIEGPEPVFFTTSLDGVYKLEISSLDPEAKFGKYEVHLKEQRVSYSEDEKIILIRKLFTEAELLRLAKKDLDKALEKYKIILTSYEELKSSGKYSNSNTKELFSPAIEQLVLVSMAETLMLSERYNESIKVYKQALDTYEKITIDLRGQANCLSNIAANEKSLGNYEKSLKIYLDALVLYKQIEDRHAELIINNNIGSIYDLIGEKKLARQYYLEALKLAEPLKDPDLPAIYNNLGLVYEDLEEHQKALNYYEKSLEMYKKANKIWNTGIVLSNMGILYDNLGDHARSLTCYKDAIKKFEEANTPISEAKTLVNMGVVYSKKTDFNNADECYKKALEIFKNKKNLQGQANVLTKIASSPLPVYDYEKKLSLLTESLNLRQACLDLYGEAYTHLLLGNVLKEKKNYTEAENYYQNSLRINTRIGDKRGEIATLYELAKLHKNLGNLDLAKSEIEKAIEVVESSRINIDIQRLRTTYFAKSHLFYEFYIDLLMQLSKSGSDEYAISAFNFSEKSRSRTFLDTLSQPTIYSQNSELISLERNQRSLLNRKVNELVVLKRDGLLEKIPVLEKEIEATRLELEKIEAKVKTDNSIRFSNHFKPLTLSTIQEKVLDSNTALFEYFLGEDQSFLWVVTKNSINTYKLPKRQTIEALAKAIDSSIKVRTESTVFTENYEIIKADKNYMEAARELSKIIVQPFLTNLNHTRILVAADECLNYVSFATLPINNLALKSKENLLITKFEIINVPSASSLVVLREKITE